MRKLDFAERIRNLRSEMDLTQWQLADVLETTQRKISYWELGKTEPTASAIISLAKFFNETTDYILGLEE